MTDRIKREVAEILLDTKAVLFNPKEPFTWASGIKSPIYCDNRLILTDVKARDVVEKRLAEQIRREFAEAEVLFGTATAGIPHAAIAASEMGLPMGYVRGGAKDHGRKSRIEGRVIPGQKAVVIEDLISTGGSVISAVEALREEGVDVIGVAALFTYGLDRSEEAFEKAGIMCQCLTDFDTVIKAARDKKYIEENEVEQILDFRKSI